jgi:hypothetical protein
MLSESYKSRRIQAFFSCSPWSTEPTCGRMPPSCGALNGFESEIRALLKNTRDGRDIPPKENICGIHPTESLLLCFSEWPWLVHHSGCGNPTLRKPSPRSPWSRKAKSALSDLRPTVGNNIYINHNRWPARMGYQSMIAARPGDQQETVVW